MLEEGGKVEFVRDFLAGLSDQAGAGVLCHHHRTSFQTLQSTLTHPPTANPPTHHMTPGDPSLLCAGRRLKTGEVERLPLPRVRHRHHHRGHAQVLRPVLPPLQVLL